MLSELLAIKTELKELEFRYEGNLNSLEGGVFGVILPVVIEV